MGKKNKKKKLDDLAAVRTVVDTLQAFDNNVRERILRWASEKLDQLADPARAKTKRKPKAAKRGKKNKSTAPAKKATKKTTRRG